MSYDEIAKLEKKLNEADSNQNLDTRDVVEELFDDKCLIVGPNGDTVDKNSVFKFHTLPNKPYSKVVVEKLDITVFEHSAIVHSLNTYYTGSDSLQIVFLRVWSKKNNQWRIVGGSATTVAKS